MKSSKPLFFKKEKKKTKISGQAYPTFPQVKLEAEECKSRINVIFEHNFLWRTREKNAEEK